MNPDNYYLSKSKMEARKSTCDRLRVGIVIVDHRGHIVVRGHNTAPDGMKTCDEAGHLMYKESCVRSLHGEQYAVAEATRNNISLVDCVAYLTHKPCISCLKLLHACKIKKIVYIEDYENTGSGKDIENIFKKEMVIELYKYKGDK